MWPSAAWHLSVRAAIDGRTARASTNRLDRDAIRAVVEQAIAITRLTEPDAESAAAGRAGGVPAGRALVRRHRANHAAGARARPWRKPSAWWKRAGQTAAGIYSTDEYRNTRC